MHNRNPYNIGILIGLAIITASLNVCLSVDISTNDGLSIELDSATGIFTGIQIDSRSIDTLSGLDGGLYFVEFSPLPANNVLFFQDFNSSPAPKILP